jgi:ATP-binding cassette subfamily B protein
MYQILDTPAPDRANDDRASLAVKTGDIRFDDVTFAYEPEKPALKSFSAHFRGGETAALVGLSGSGKSTVFNLLLRFWPLEAGHGRIEIDGQDITAVNLASLRAGMSLVSQDAFMFEGTIADNIRAGASDRDEAAVVAAAKAAYAHDFIMGFPLGYQTPVGELGGTLSGGQRQRISIARAFLKDAPIILLDEPTSALDSETEHAIQQALAVLTRNRTTIIIAHRFSTIQHADRIFVLQAGEVVEEGSHAELYAKGGVYRRLHSLQFAGTAA